MTTISYFDKPEVASHLLVYRQRYIETIYFWDQCDKSYQMRQKVIFNLQEVAIYLPYFTQKYRETTYLSYQLEETDDMMPILTLKKRNKLLFNKFEN